jgi:hypothetical protein
MKFFITLGHALPTNIELGWKALQGKNTLAYNELINNGCNFLFFIFSRPQGILSS